MSATAQTPTPIGGRGRDRRSSSSDVEGEDRALVTSASTSMGADASAAATAFGLEGHEEAYELQERKLSEEEEEAAYDDDDEDYDEEDDEHEALAANGDRRRRRRRRRRRAMRRDSGSSIARSRLDYTPDEERAVVRKFDRRLVLFLALCYMLSFLDRSNIGNARIAGMEEDLQTDPPNDGWYEWALTSFYIAYIAFEWMSLLWKLIPAHIYVSMIILSWGITASLQAVATSYPVLIALRTLLGIGEAGFTGVPFYLSFFFKRDELAFRTAIFISAAPLATTFASSLAWLILKLGAAGPIAPWRLLFLIEGFPSVLVSLAAWGIIPDSPQSASYLTPREKKVARVRLRYESQSHSGSGGRSHHQSEKNPSSTERLQPLDALAVLRDPKAWLTALMFFLSNMAYSSLPVFLPTILTDMGHTPLSSQALSAPPYLLSFLTVLFTAHLSDRLGMRTPFVVLHAVASALGYLVMALARPLGLGLTLRYLSVYPAAVGFFNVVVLILAWSINNQPSDSRRGGGFALLQVVGQCGPLLGTHLYPESDAPFFERGMWACAAAMLGVAGLALTLRVYLGRLNRRMDREEDGGDGNGRKEEREGLVGDKGWRNGQVRRFRFML